MSKLDETSLALQQVCNLWTSQDYDTRELDDFKQGDNNFEIRFAIPNGGIIGVSIWALSHKAGWYLPTELHPQHKALWYRDPKPNLALAKTGLRIIKKFLKIKKPRKPKPTSLPANMVQLNLLDMPTVYSSETVPVKSIAPPAKPVAKPTTKKPLFTIGDVVIATAGRELATHRINPLTITGFSSLGAPLVRLPMGMDWPVNPNNIRPATIEDFQAQPPAPETSIVNSEAREIYKEWRWWPSTHQWTFTGAMGFDIKAHHPNSSLFEASINPNEFKTYIPN